MMLLTLGVPKKMSVPERSPGPDFSDSPEWRPSGINSSTGWEVNGGVRFSSDPLKGFWTNYETLAWVTRATLDDSNKVLKSNYIK